MFTCSSSHCPSARCVSTENAVYKLTDIFRNFCLSAKSLNWLIYFVFVVSCLLCPVLSYCCYLCSCWLCNWPLAVELTT
jgi:hypothetical protein